MLRSGQAIKTAEQIFNYDFISILLLFSEVLKLYVYYTNQKQKEVLYQLCMYIKTFI